MTFPGFIFLSFSDHVREFIAIWRGENFHALFIIYCWSWIGFCWAFSRRDSSIRFLDVGTVHVGFGILGVIVFLGLGYWLIPEKKSV